MDQLGKMQNIFSKRTRTAFIWTRILNTPFWALFSMLPFILYKDLHATPFQVTAIIILKPLSSIFSTYWSGMINKRPDRLRANVIWAVILGLLPFFCFPFIDNVWFFIFSSAMYMVFAQRGAIPAWMEILKLNIPGVSRGRLFAYVSSLGYIGDAAWPFVLGWFLDGYIQAWRFLFPLTAFISILAVFLQARILIPQDGKAIEEKLLIKMSLAGFKKQLLKPWQNAWEILSKRQDFARFQVGFMLAGSGLIIMQPVLPGFFIDNLHLSYTELGVAITLCKSVGFATTSTLWARLLNRVDINRLIGWVAAVACLYAFFLLFAQYQLFWVYAAYLGYGVMQAGSELYWNMSGPIFAKDEDSSAYSSVNVLMVGVRGCLMPILGSLLAIWTSSSVVIFLGGCLLFISMQKMLAYSREAEVGTQEI